MVIPALFLLAPLLFPDLHPAAVWIGLCVTIGPIWVLRNSDNGLGNCEGWIQREERADEAAQWLRCMNDRRCA